MNAVPTTESPVNNRRVALVGKLGSMNRKQARQLIRDNGGTVVDRVDPSVDVIVIGADQLPVSDGQLLDDRIIEAAERGDLRILSETELWQELGHVDETAEASLYTPAMLAHLLELPISTIRRWIRRGLITPVKQFKNLSYFDFQEVASARHIAGLIAEGNSPQAIETKLSKLARLYPHLDRPLSQLSVIVSGRNVLLRQGQGLVAPGGGQMLFDFDSGGEDDASTLAMPEPAVLSIHTPLDEPHEPADISTDGLKTREEFLQLAIELEDADQLDAATEVYRTMGLALGPGAEACFRLAEILYLQGNLQAARERYYSAIEIDSGFVEARASLGCVLVELDQPELAISAFRGALDHHEEYPDVHFHLARVLDEQNDPETAETHWRRFLELAPVSPWAIEARERLGIVDP